MPAGIQVDDGGFDSLESKIVSVIRQVPACLSLTGAERHVGEDYSLLNFADQEADGYRI